MWYTWEEDSGDAVRERTLELAADVRADMKELRSEMYQQESKEESR